MLSVEVLYALQTIGPDILRLVLPAQLYRLNVRLTPKFATGRH